MNLPVKPRPMSKAPMVAGCLAVATLMLAMSGACSQHEPGTYEGGGRSFEVPTAQGTSTTPDSSTKDTFVPDNSTPDTFVLPESGGGG